ncbi:MAG TPA: hypothetical protein VKA48_03600 [Gammaproteobacteria bacterium]|nr:hypothetical protein [Gammaproteobacteria bacterium]
MLESHNPEWARKTVKAAREGDPDAIKKALCAYKAAVDRGRTPDPILMKFVSQALDKIDDRTKGVIPILAGTGNGAGRPPAYDDEWIAEIVLTVRQGCSSLEKAFARVASMDSVPLSERQVRRVYEKHKARWQNHGS